MTVILHPPVPPVSSRPEGGNVLFIILLAVMLIGLLSAAILSTNDSQNANIDPETLAIKASQVQSYAAELERGVKYILQNGQSEADLRFAHPDAPSSYGSISTSPATQLFNKSGGGAGYQQPPAGVNDGSRWEFYGGTAVPGAGTSAADLVAVLPNVTESFCQKINALDGQSDQPKDTGTAASGSTAAGDCIFMGDPGRFNDGAGQNFYTTPNTMDETTFTQDPNTSAARPAFQACVKCDLSSTSYQFYHVLLAR
jgi:hypothetical protein